MIDYLPLVLTGLGLTASIFYYSLQLRNQTKTRHTQLIFSVQGNRSNKDGLLRYLNTLDITWKDYEDFHRKYWLKTDVDQLAEWYSFLTQFNDFGYMLKLGITDIETMYQINYPSIVFLWEKFKPIIVERRRRDEYSQIEMQWFQYLAEELVKYAESKGTTSHNTSKFKENFIDNR